MRDGLQALEDGDRKKISLPLRREFAESLYLDKASGVPAQWDYVLGLRRVTRQNLVCVEVHDARPGEVTKVLKKMATAKATFRDELEGGAAHVAGWYWIASGPDGLSRMGTALRRLSNEGIIYVGEQLKPKHMPGPL